MIVKPNIGARIFSATAGFTLLIMACFGISIPPMGLIFTCIGGPLAIFSLGYTFGVAHTRVDGEGVFQRNFFFMSKKFAWNEIASAKIESINFNRVDSSGWTSRGTRTHMLFVNNDGKKIYVNANGTGQENWWDDLRKTAMEKLGERFGK